MGFGYLFVGYFFLIFFPLSRVDLLPNLSLIGCVLMYMGLRRLCFCCPDSRNFKKAMVSLAALFTVSVTSLAFDIAEICGVLNESFEMYIGPAVGGAYAIVSAFFVFTLFGGIYRLSREVGLPALAKRTVWMISISILYTVCEVVSSACSVIVGVLEYPSDFIIMTAGYLGIFAFLLSYLAIFLILALLFSAYARICLEGDEDMPYREDIFDKIVAWTKRNKQ